MTMNMFTKGLMPLEAAFNKRLPTVYTAMRQRFGERRFKSGPRKGQVFRAAIPLPFTKEEFLAWVEKELGGKNGIVHCTYCGVMLDARNVGFDHPEPIKQGGSVGFENLVCCCQPCNKFKGGLTVTGFNFLKNILKQGIPEYFTRADSAEIEQRLRGGGGFYKTREKANDATAKLAQQQKDDDDW